MTNSNLAYLSLPFTLDSGEEVVVNLAMCAPDRDAGIVDWTADEWFVVDSTHELTQAELTRAEGIALEHIHESDADAEKEYDNYDGD